MGSHRNAVGGDANLDGKVDGSDYSRIDAGWLSHATGWYAGDFNYDGAVDASDYSLIDNTYNRQTAPLSPTALAAGMTESAAAVPEPVTCAVAMLSVVGPWRRRRWTGGHG